MLYPKGFAYIWDLNRIESQFKNIRPSFSLPHFDEVTVVEVDPKLSTIFTSSDDQRINRWSLYSTKQVKDYEPKPLFAQPFEEPDRENFKR